MIFRFRHFSVSHSASAMKVGTDGVTLGAWARCNGNVLDVGAGCGLIGLMAAQRGASSVKMIEIDSAAANEAEENIRRSPWAAKLSVICADFLESEISEKFDNIISNPPFFATGELAPDQARAIARHQGKLTPLAFMNKAAKMLTSDGRISIIIPPDLQADWEFAARLSSLHCSRCTRLFTRKRAIEPRRILLEFSNTAQSEAISTSLNIHSEEYKELVKDFYL